MWGDVSSRLPPRAAPRDAARTIRVAIADDHELFRGGLRQLLANEPDIAVVAELDDGRAVLNAVEKDSWDVLVLDLTLPFVSGMEVLHRIHQTNPTLRVLVLSMYSAEHYGPRARCRSRRVPLQDRAFSQGRRCATRARPG